MGDKIVDTDIEETARKVKTMKTKEWLLHYLYIFD